MPVQMLPAADLNYDQAALRFLTWDPDTEEARVAFLAHPGAEPDGVHGHVFRVAVRDEAVAREIVRRFNGPGDRGAARPASPAAEVRHGSAEPDSATLLERARRQVEGCAFDREESPRRREARVRERARALAIAASPVGRAAARIGAALEGLIAAAAAFQAEYEDDGAARAVRVALAAAGLEPETGDCHYTADHFGPTVAELNTWLPVLEVINERLEDCEADARPGPDEPPADLAPKLLGAALSPESRAIMRAVAGQPAPVLAKVVVAAVAGAIERSAAYALLRELVGRGLLRETGEGYEIADASLWDAIRAHDDAAHAA